MHFKIHQNFDSRKITSYDSLDTLFLSNKLLILIFYQIFIIFATGNCSDLVNGFNCSCQSGFNGTQCEHNIDDCPSSGCGNGGEIA